MQPTVTTYGTTTSYRLRATPSLPVAIYCSQCDAGDHRIRLPFFLSSSTRYTTKKINRQKNRTYNYRIRPRKPNTVRKTNYGTNGILQNFGQIFKDRAVGKTQAYQTTHHIKTTPELPEACWLQEDLPDKYIATKNEFNLLLEESINQPSKSPWSPPLHMIPKRKDAWRPCRLHAIKRARKTPKTDIQYHT